MKLVDRIPYAAMLQDRQERLHPPVRRLRFPLKTRWHIITLRSWDTWRDVWRNLRYVIRG